MTLHDAVAILLFILVVVWATWLRHSIRQEFLSRPQIREQAAEPQPEAPKVEYAIRPPEPPKPPRDLITIRFLSEKGKTLGHTRIERRQRRPTMQWRHSNGTLYNFVAQMEDGKDFVYRRVGKDA